jgi:hypothetical protein
MSAHSVFLLPFGFVFASMVVGVIFSAIRGKKRGQQMASEAQALGLTFSLWNGPELAPKLHTPFFNTGSRFAFKNIMTGAFSGLEVQVFDYSRSSGSASNSTSTAQTVAVYTQSIDFPVFALGPGGVAAKIINAIEHQNVEINDGEFSHRYSVRGPEKDRIRALFGEALIRFLKDLDHGKQWQIEGAGKNLIIYRFARRIKPADLRDFLQETSSIAQSFFAYAGTTKPSSFSAFSR